MNKRPGGGSWNRRSNPSSKDIPGMRRQRSLEWRNERDSSSDDDIGRPVESHIFASLLVQARKEFKDEMQRNYGSDDTEDPVTTDPTTPFPTPPTSILSPRSPIPLHRQASPFPLESINQPRRINYQHQSERLRSVTVPGEVVYATGNKKAISNNVVASTTLGRSSGAAAGRRHRMGGMTSSSSATSCNSSNGNENILQPNGDVPYHHVEQHARRLSNDVAEDSPPEPAPPEIPPRGGSLHSATLRRKAEFQLLSNGEVLTCEDTPYHQADYVLGGSPRASVFPARSPIMAPQPSNANNQHRFVGYYNFHLPILLLTDPELIKQIGIKDFEHFVDHPPIADPEADPLWSKNLLSLTGAKWREMRRLLTPTFTSSKIKSMYILIEEAARNFSTYFKERQNEGIIEVEVKEIFTRFTNDIIATTAFGVKVDSVRDPKNQFYLMGKQMTDFAGFFKLFRFIIGQVSPKIARIFGFRIIDTQCAEFFSGVIDETVKQREKNKLKRHDMIDLLLQARKDQANTNSAPITNFDITSQACIFFFGGFETVSNVMALGAYELATNKNVQDKLRQEIKKYVNDDGKISYEALQEMKYMDMVVSEILRKWPPFPIADRVCTKPYTIKALDKNSKDIPIFLDQEIQIPTYAIQNDPKYFPDPQKFDPERFSEENLKNIVPYTYIPFGIGPRNCIGNRLSLTEVKLMFFYLLLNCELVPVKKTLVPPILTKDVLSSMVGGTWVGIKYLE